MPRIVGGTAHGREIKLPPGEVRPATARVRKALFDYLSKYIAGTKVLDLYCGSGGLGLEALSRGASEAWFVDLSERVIDIARQNARALDLYERSHFLKFDVFRLLRHFEERIDAKFDLILASPPYRIAQPDKLLRAIAESEALLPDGVVCLEYSKHTKFPDPDNYTLDRRKAYGETILDIWDFRPAGSNPQNSSDMFPEIKFSIENALNEIELIPDQRKNALDVLARQIAAQIQEYKRVKLVFICTHNSRRSQIAQAWACTAIQYYNLDFIEVYSGGTEATSFNPRAVKTLIEAGFRIELEDEGTNPVYIVRNSVQDSELRMFSKKFSDSPNPDAGFWAVMTCSAADEACPIVPGAEARFSLPYEDPQEFDGTEQESSVYSERCKQIATEMLCLFSEVNKFLN